MYRLVVNKYCILVEQSQVSFLSYFSGSQQI